MIEKMNKIGIESHIKVIWKTPLYITINNERLAKYLKAAARSGIGVGDCSADDSR